MIVFEIVWAAVCAAFVYVIIQCVIRMVTNYLAAKERRRLEEEETKDLREEPPVWGDQNW